MSILVKKAQVNDARHIAGLGRTTFQETFGHLFPVAAELEIYLQNTFSVEKIASSLAKDNNVFWLAWDGQTPVGYAKLKIKSWHNDEETEGVSQLQKIYVLQAYLDQKIGKLLYETLEQEVLKIGSKKLWLVVLHTNEKAIRFYEKAGFVKTQKHYYTIGSQKFEFELMSKSW